jgi:cytochrome c oxidase subunit 3
MAEDSLNSGAITAAAGTHPSAEPAAIFDHAPHRRAPGGVAHHFDDAAQQHHAATLGMWAFLATEILFFGALLTCYGVYRFDYPEPFRIGSHHLKEWAGAINTAVLLCSSLAMALAVRAAQLHRRRDLIRFLLATIVLGAMFLGIKAIEYTLEYRDHLVPNLNFHFEETLEPGHIPNGPKVELFMTFYFILTGLHALHMTIGLGLMVILILMARRGRFDVGNVNLVEMSGLYWHFVDLVWIFLFPLLYLIR